MWGHLRTSPDACGCIVPGSAVGALQQGRATVVLQARGREGGQVRLRRLGAGRRAPGQPYLSLWGWGLLNDA